MDYLAFDFVLLGAGVDHEDTFQAIGVGCRYLLEALLEHVVVAEGYLPVIKVNDDIPLFDDSRDKHEFFDGLKQVGYC